MPHQKPHSAPPASLLRFVLPARLAALGVGALAAIACGRSTLPEGPYGAACAGTSCGESRACIAAFPGGYCSEACDASRPCDAGGLCDEGVGGYCLAACATGDDCRDEYMCWRGACRPDCTSDESCGVPGARCVGGACVAPACTTSAECGAGRLCVEGACVAAPDAGPPPDGRVLRNAGDACASSVECASGVCLPPARGGVCSVACADFGACAASIPFSAACGAASIDGMTGTFCVPYDDAGLATGRACTADADCASGTCAAGLCTEGCDDQGDCDAVGAGWGCSAVGWGGGSITACNWPSVSAVTLSSVDLGTVSLGAGRLTPDERLVVPADSVSTTLRAELVSGDSLPLSFYEAYAPDGLRIYSVNELGMLVDQHVRWIPGNDYEAVAMLVPNGSPGRRISGVGFTYGPGPYRFTVGAYERMAGDTGTGSVRLSALVKRAPGGVVSAGTLDLAIHLVGVGVTAAAAPGDARVTAFRTRLDQLLMQVGIRVGTVSYHDVSAGALAVIDSTDGPTSELSQLFRLSAGRTGNVASIFLVRSINAGGEGFNTLGIAGGIPGPSAIHGSMSSGVVVAFDPAVVGAGATGGRFAGHVGAHELSHFLGLFHVTERLRACGAGEVPPACAPFGSTDTIADTTRGDTTNLMHWSIVGSGSNTALTAGQGYVLLRSAIVR